MEEEMKKNIIKLIIVLLVLATLPNLSLRAGQGPIPSPEAVPWRADR